MGRYRAKSKPAPTVEKNPTKYFARVRPGGLSWLEPSPKRTELTVRRMTQLRLENVTFCLTMRMDRRRLKTSCEERRREEVDTGRLEFPIEKRRLLRPNMRPTKIEIAKILGVNWVKGLLEVRLRK